MENDPEFIRREEFDASIAALLGVVGQAVTMVEALALVLHQRGIVTPEAWKSVVDKAQMGQWATKVREAVEKLTQNSPLANALRDFEGPIQ